MPQETVANFATVKPDATGNVCVFTNPSAQVIVDVMGTIGRRSPAWQCLCAPSTAGRSIRRQFADIVHITRSVGLLDLRP